MQGCPYEVKSLNVCPRACRGLRGGAFGTKDQKNKYQNTGSKAEEPCEEARARRAPTQSNLHWLLNKKYALQRRGTQADPRLTLQLRARRRVQNDPNTPACREGDALDGSLKAERFPVRMRSKAWPRFFSEPSTLKTKSKNRLEEAEHAHRRALYVQLRSSL